MDDKIDTSNLRNFSLYYSGYRQGVIDLYKTIKETSKWKDKKVYTEAIYRFLIDSLTNCELYHINDGNGYFKNHVNDKNGKLKECQFHIK